MNNLLRRIMLKTFIIKRPAARKLHCSRTYAGVAEFPQNNSIAPSYVKLPPLTGEIQKQNYDYFLVLDFEATCDSPVNVVPQEIIEFPVLKINGKTFETESIFHSYVRPTVNPQLPTFCSELTGITQDMVDDEPDFQEVYEGFKLWLQQENLLSSDVSFMCVTCGDWDLKYLFPVQCKGLRIPVPDFMRRWINVKLSFAETSQSWPRNLTTMIKFCELEREGRLHSGIDDCKNIAKVFKNLAERGLVFECNGRTY